MRAAIACTAFLVACASSNNKTEPPRPPPPEVVYVSPDGNDGTDGSRPRPFRTIARALELASVTEIVLAGGEHPAPSLEITRRLAFTGPDEGRALITGHVAIRANDVALTRVDVGAGLTIARASGVNITSAHVRPGERPSAITLESARATLDGVTADCGAETCLEITSSTVTVRAAKLTAGPSSKRGLRAVTSSVTAYDVEITGGSHNQLLAGRRTRMLLAGAVLTGAGSTALAAVDDANVRAERIAISGASRFGVLVQASRLSLKDATIGPMQGIAAGITGGDVDLISVAIDSAREGALSVSAHHGRVSQVRLIGGAITHGPHTAVLLSQGELTIQGTSFAGAPGAKTEGGDAIIANSPDAVLNLLGATISDPAGFGVTMTNGASGTITATITKPRTGGVYVEGVAGARVEIRGGRIAACGTGSGVAVLDSTDVEIIATTITGCPEAGVLAGQGAHVGVDRAKLSGNREYGIAAFGRASVLVRSTKAERSRWATFASCGDGARVEDGGGNKLSGAAATCP